MKLLLPIFLLFTTQISHAKLFSNSYVSFELPPHWNCYLEKTEWICRSEMAGAQKEAVIILTAKEVGAGDSLQQYEAFLKAPKAVADQRGKPAQSQIKSVKNIQIAGHAWVDGMHLGSEVPYYYTRYLATIKLRIAILVTFSAHQRYYTKYSSDFFKAIQSLRVIAAPNLLAQSGSGTGLPGGQTLGSPVGIPSDVVDSELPLEPSGSSGSKKNILLLAVILGAVGIYFFLKKGQKKNKNPFE